MQRVLNQSSHSIRISGILAAAVVSAALACQAAHASILTLDPGATPAHPTDGAGPWDAGITANWSNASDPAGQSPNSPSDVVWPNSGSDTAIFGDGGGTVGITTNYSVTVASGGVSVGAITFNPLAAGGSNSHSTDYQIFGGPITLGQPNTVITENNVSSTNLSTFPDAEITSQLTGTGGLTVTGPGVFTIGNLGTGAAANNYTGGTTILNGTVQVGNISSANGRSKTIVTSPFGALNSSVVLSNGTISPNNSGTTQTFPYAFTITGGTNNTINGGGSTFQTTIGGTTGVPANPSGSVTGNGNLTFNTNGTGTANIMANFSTFTGNFLLTGASNVRAYANGGTFTGSAGMAFDIESTTSAISLSPQTSSGAGNTYSFGSLTSATASAILNGGTAGPVNYSIGALNTNTTFAGSIGSGTSATLNAALTKIGTGSLTLTNTTNPYTGLTNVNGGALLVNGAITGSTVNVGISGLLGGSGLVTQTVNDNGEIDPGAAGPGSIGQLSLDTGINFTGGTFAAEFSATTSDLLAVIGNIALGSNTALVMSAVDGTTDGTYTIASYTGTLTGTFATVPAFATVNYGTGSNSVITVTIAGAPAPEPTSLALLGLGAAAFAGRRRTSK